MNAPPIESQSPLVLAVALVVVFTLSVLVLQAACYVCRLEKLPFGKASLVLAATFICGVATSQILHVERHDARYLLHVAVTSALSVLIYCLMLELNLFDALRLHITTWLLAITGGVVIALALMGGVMLLSPPQSETTPAASLPAATAPATPPPAGSFFRNGSGG